MHGAGLLNAVGAPQVMPVVDDVDLLRIAVALYQAHSPWVRPAGYAHTFQASQQPLPVGLERFVSTAYTGALAQRGAKAGAAWGKFFQTQRAIAQALLVGQLAQGL